MSDLLHGKSNDDRSCQRDSEVAEGLAVWRLNWQVCSQAILSRKLIGRAIHGCLLLRSPQGSSYGAMLVTTSVI